MTHLELSGRQAVRLVVNLNLTASPSHSANLSAESRMAGTRSLRELLYIAKDENNRMWTITFSTTAARFGSAVDDFIDTLSETQLSQPTRPPDAPTRTVQNVLLTHLAHDNRHLGMIEALRGVLGLRGSATI